MTSGNLTTADAQRKVWDNYNTEVAASYVRQFARAIWAARTGLEATSYGDPDLAAGGWHTAAVDASGRVLAKGK